MAETSSELGRFDRDTAVECVAPGRYRATIDAGWWIARGPNGGYLAAIMLRAIEATVGDAERSPRSFSLHFLAPPTEGEALIEVSVERAGRSMTSVSARLIQDGRVMVTALAALSKPFAGDVVLSHCMPEVRAPEDLERAQRSIPMNERYDLRHAVGDMPFTGSKSALTGGWIRLADPRALDAPLVAAFTDSMPPALFPTLAARSHTGGVPTVDLTVHFRTPLPPAGMRDDDFVLAVFRSTHAEQGFVEEDGEIWSRDGRLLAQSRQLAVLF